MKSIGHDLNFSLCQQICVLGGGRGGEEEEEEEGATRTGLLEDRRICLHHIELVAEVFDVSRRPPQGLLKDFDPPCEKEARISNQEGTGGR